MHNSIGFRIKSGWAMAILVAGDNQSARALDRRIIRLSDESIPATKQPYHVIEEIADAAEAEKEIARLCKIVSRIGNQEVTKLLKEYAGKYKLKSGGLVVGSDIDPQKIG